MNNLLIFYHKNKIYHGDCFDFMKKVPDNFFDLIITDPPYGRTKNDWDREINLEFFWKEIKRIAKPNTASIIFSMQPFTTDLIISNRKNFRYEIIWEKTSATGFLNAEKMPLRAHENILFFYEKLPFYNPIKTKGTKKVSRAIHKTKCKQSDNYGKQTYSKDYCSDERYPRSIIKFSTDKQRCNFHPTQKPLELIKHLLKMYSQKDFKIFDPFMGSGTVAVACKSMGIDFWGCELESEYIDIANKRLSKVQKSFIFEESA